MANPAKKSKFNRKFLTLGIGLMLFVGLVLGGIAYYQITVAPERNIRIGDECMVAARAAESAGNVDEAYKKYQEAISRYGRAVSKKPNNLMYNQKILDTLALMTPKTSGDAQELYLRRESLLRRRTRSAPLDGEQWMGLLAALNERAQLFGEPGLWVEVAKVATEALDRLPASSPQVATIRALSVKAALRQGGVLSTSERAAGEESARVYLKEFPADASIWAEYLRSIAEDSSRLAAASRTTEAVARSAQYDAVLAQARGLHPDSVMLSIVELEHLVDRRRARNPLATPAAIAAVADPLLWKGSDRDSPDFGTCGNLPGDVMQNFVGVIGTISDPTMTARAVEILQAYIARNPAAMLEIGALGRMQRSIEQFDAARKSFEQLLNIPSPKVSILAAYSDEVKVTAIEQIFELDFAQWEGAVTDDEKSTALANVKADRQRIATIIQGREGELALIRADAKVAFAQQDYLTAVTRLEEVFIRQKNVAPELYLIAAISLLERGEPGAALLKIERALEEHPDVGQFLLVRARIQGQLGRISDAKRTLDFMLGKDPTNSGALEMMAMLNKVGGDGSLNLSDPIIKILGDAELAANEGNIDEALTQIRTALERFPTDLRLQRTLVQWILFKGDAPKANKLVGEFLVANPTDEALQRLQVISGVGTPVGRVALFVDLSQRSATEKTVDLAIALLNLRDNLKSRVLVSAPAEVAALTADVSEAEAASKVAVAKAIEVAPGDAALLDRLFVEATVAKSEAQYAKLIELAEKHSTDPTVPLLLRGRVAAERKDFKTAAELFEQAQELPSASATGYRLLGFARERLGDVAGAEEAYAKSYQRRPNDLITIQLYSALLSRHGKLDRAREVMRSAMLAMPQSSEVRSAYLDLESQFGNISDTLLGRRRMYAIRPADADNARQLMRILMSTPPTRELIFNNDGTATFPPKEWEALGRDRQAQELELLSRNHHEEAQAIFERLMRINPADRASTRTYGASMQRAGRGTEAIAALTVMAEKSTGIKAWASWMDLGELQLEAERIDDAQQSLDRAMADSQGESHDAALMISILWSERHQPRRAIALLTTELAKKPSIDIARQLAALRTEVRDFAGAREAIEQVAKLSPSGDTFSDQLLAADIANAELEESFSTFTPEESAKKVSDFSQAIEHAMRLDPSSGVPFVVRGGSAQRRYQRTGDVELLKKAKADALRGIELQGNYWPAVRLLASLQLEEGDLGAATQTVRQFTGQNPRMQDARRSLIGYLLAAGDYTGAIRAVEEVLAAEPKNPTWWKVLAEAHIAAGKTLDAAADYQQMYSITRDQSALTTSLVMRATNIPPDFEGILGVLRTTSDSTASVPFLQMIGAAAIAGSADSDRQRTQGMVQLRDMYKLVGQSHGELTDPWVLSVSTLFPFAQTAEFEKFVLEACADKPDSSLCRAVSQRFLESGPSGYAKARSYATRALELGEDNAQKFNALRVLGGLEYRVGNFALAADSFEKSLSFNPTDMAALNNIAYIEARDLNKAAQAVKRARKALIDYPISTDLMDTLGYALTKVGEYPEAITLLGRASRIQPSAMVFAHLAAAQLAAGRHADAVLSITRAKALTADADAAAECAIVEKLLSASPR
ncbi:MAG: tetratricopeptide repeat protein [Phycisphaerales bacterium]|nr:tetratricopeptide repeat protein [Phycisphaerales bacterium]